MEAAPSTQELNRNPFRSRRVGGPGRRIEATTETVMNSIIYIVGLIVVILVVLSFLGLR
jgi:hypothetical protein